MAICSVATSGAAPAQDAADPIRPARVRTEAS
jgi:hypothetical protein